MNIFFYFFFFFFFIAHVASGLQRRQPPLFCLIQRPPHTAMVPIGIPVGIKVHNGQTIGMALSSELGLGLRASYMTGCQRCRLSVASGRRSQRNLLVTRRWSLAVELTESQCSTSVHVWPYTTVVRGDNITQVNGEWNCEHFDPTEIGLQYYYYGDFRSHVAP